MSQKKAASKKLEKVNDQNFKDIVGGTSGVKTLQGSTESAKALKRKS